MRRHARALVRSTTTRFVLLVFVIQIVVTGAVLLFVQQTRTTAIAAEQQALVSELRDEMLADYESGGRTRLVKRIRRQLDAVGSDIAVLLLADKAGRPIAGNLDAWPAVLPPAAAWRTIDLYRSGGDRPEHMGVVATRLDDGSRLLTGNVLDAHVRMSQITEQAMLIALLLSIPLALLVALTLSRIISRRIGRIAQTAAAVGDGNFAQRVPLDASGDAFDTLGAVLNAMLDRTEMLVSELRVVTDSLAHDLRSPITRLKSVLERAIVETRDPAALAALETVSGEAETLLSMLSTALSISRAEAGIGREMLAETDIGALLTDIAEIYGPLVEDQGAEIAVSAPDGLIFAVHRPLVSQALGNLIENALKYAHGGTRISIEASTGAGALTLTVADDGPGIPPEQHETALRRFGRLDEARRLSGSGLGLSLVAAVARLHGGRVVLEDNAPGLRVVMTLVDQRGGRDDGLA
jgi:signal transduction histidine kinase